MTSKREGIIQAVASRLANVTGVDNRIYRSRVEALTRAESPALILEQIQTSASLSNFDFIDWNLQFRVIVIVRGAEPDALADPIIASLYSVIMADRTLGNLVFDVLPVNQTFQLAEGDQSVCLVECVFACQHRTSATDIGA